MVVLVVGGVAVVVVVEIFVVVAMTLTHHSFDNYSKNRTLVIWVAQPPNELQRAPSVLL